jgi:HK97 family phage portal protein
MTLFRSILNGVRSGVLRSVGLADLDAWMDHVLGYGGNLSAAGIPVNNQTALNFNPVLAAAIILGEELASMDLNVYERGGDGTKNITDSEVAYKLAFEPNPRMSSYTWRLIGMGHCIWRGNFVNLLQWNDAMRLRYIWPLHPDHVRWMFYPQQPAAVDWSGLNPAENELWYYARKRNGEWRPIADEDILHIKGLGSDGVTGYNIIELLADSLGVPMAAERFGARYFANDATPGVILKHPGKLSDKAHANIKKSFEERHRGVDNSHVLGIIEEGMDVTALDVKANESQLLETLRYGVENVSRVTRIPLHMLGDLSRSTNNNIEHQGLEFGKHCMRPKCRNWEQEINRKLFRGTKLFPEFDLSELYRGDAKSRAEANQIKFNCGEIDIDEWRRDDGRNPLPGGLGKVRIIPLNMQMLPVPGAPKIEPPEPKAVAKQEGQK